MLLVGSHDEAEAEAVVLYYYYCVNYMGNEMRGSS